MRWLIFVSVLIFCTPSFSKIRTLVLDPAHGGQINGALLGDTYEKEATLMLAKALSHPNNAKLDIVLTRKQDYPMPYQGRIGIANHQENGLFLHLKVTPLVDQPRISIYTMAPQNSKRSETPFLIPIEKVHNLWVSKSVVLAQEILATLPPSIQSTHFHTPYAIESLQGIDMPAVMIELETGMLTQSLIDELVERIWVAIKTFSRKEKKL